MGVAFQVSFSFHFPSGTHSHSGGKRRGIIITIMEAETQPAGLGGEGEEVEELLAQGRRYYICSNFSLASQSFQEACQMLSEKHGEMSKELVEPYYWYGKSLLEQARQESCVLGGGVPAPPTQSESSSDEEEEPTTSNDQTEDSAQAEATPTEGEGSREVENVKEATPTEGEGSKEATPTGEETEEDKDVTTLQLAWEVLEVAKLISQNLQSTDYQLLLAEINLLLGEIGLESDQYEQAIDDFTTCLQIREAVLTADDRKLAEIHFNLGLTYSLLKKPQESVAEFDLAKQVLELRKEKLQCDADKETIEGEKIKCLKEIDEISDLLPDIEAKIVEELTVADESKKAGGIGLEEEEDDEEGVSCSSSGFNTISSTGMNIFTGFNQETALSNGVVSSSTSSSSSSGHVPPPPVNDISHLVKKKPKVSDQQSKGELPVTTNGSLSHNEAVPLKKRRISLTTVTEDGADLPARKKVPSLLTNNTGELTEADSTTTPAEQ